MCMLVRVQPNREAHVTERVVQRNWTSFFVSQMCWDLHTLTPLVFALGGAMMTARSIANYAEIP